MSAFEKISKIMKKEVLSGHSEKMTKANQKSLREADKFFKKACGRER